MGLITAKDIAKGLETQSLGILEKPAINLLMWSTGITALNKLYDAIQQHQYEGLDFLKQALKQCGIVYSIPKEDLERIPKEGGFVTVSNHPLGAIDGILLMALLLERRPDFKVTANFLLQTVTPIKDYILGVNPFEDRKHIKSSVSGLRQSIAHVQKGNGLGIFPAGEVSCQKENGIYMDRPWPKSTVKLIQNLNVPVIPIYFHAKNSNLFYQLAKLHPILRTAKLPSEILSQYKRPIQVRIGKPISVAQQKQFEGNTEGYRDFLRTKTYMLANTLSKEVLYKSKFGLKNTLKDLKENNKLKTNTQQQIIHQEATSVLTKEVQWCRTHHKRLLESKNYEVYLATQKEVPHIVKEIGRLREITFRAIGEGTNNATDLDHFDTYYHHLFLWDTTQNKIAGAYRMGLGQEIYKKHGIDGFYLQDLFRFEPELHGMMSESIEMGRAFVIEAYQQRPMPLFLLWRGIIHVTLRFPEHKYLIGGVSISNQFSDFSKSLMIEFMKSNYYDPYIAQYIRPKKEFKVTLRDADKDFVFDHTKSDLNKFDKIIDELEPGNLRLPVLIKKYIKQNAKVVAFNVDPLFNNAIDGLMYIRISDLPESTVKPVIEDFQSSLEQQV